jgi:hypothetical protein
MSRLAPISPNHAILGFFSAALDRHTACVTLVNMYIGNKVQRARGMPRSIPLER